MYDQAIVHIGPFKTGSTSIQYKLSSLRDWLAENGICYSPGSHIADINLGAALVSDNSDHSIINADGWRFEFNNDLSKTLNLSYNYDSTFHKRLFSYEGLSVADKTKVDSWVSAFPAKELSIICMIREPIRWLLSAYFQHSMTYVVEWDEFIDHHLHSRDFFISKLSSLWSHDKTVFNVIPLTGTADAWKLFCEFLKLTPPDFSSILRDKNISPPFIESLYSSSTPLFIDSFIAQFSYITGDIPPGFIGRTLIDILDLSRPFCEFSMQFNAENFIKINACREGLSSLEMKYRDLWLGDLENYIKSIRDNTQVDVLKNALAHFSHPSHDSLLFPSQNFRKVLPINSSWSSIMRLIALSICLRYQSLSM